MDFLKIDSIRAEQRLKALYKQLDENLSKLKINDFKTDWDKTYTEHQIEEAKTGIIALIRNLM